MSAILPGIVEEAERLLDAASGNGTTLALLGGVAVRLKASDVPASLDREYKDIDFAVAQGPVSSVAAKLLSAARATSLPSQFNAMNGQRPAAVLRPRSTAARSTCSWARFWMCHEIPIAERLEPGARHGAARRAPAHQAADRRAQREGRTRHLTLLCYHHEVGRPPRRRASTPAVIAELCAERLGSVAHDQGSTRALQASARPTTELDGPADQRAGQRSPRRSCGSASTPSPRAAEVAAARPARRTQALVRAARGSRPLTRLRPA